MTLGSALVNILASCSSVGQYFISMSPFASTSHKKWYLISICVVRLSSTELLAITIAYSLQEPPGEG